MRLAICSLQRCSCNLHRFCAAYCEVCALFRCKGGAIHYNRLLVWGNAVVWHRTQKHVKKTKTPCYIYQSIIINPNGRISTAALGLDVTRSELGKAVSCAEVHAWGSCLVWHKCQISKSEWWWRYKMVKNKQTNNYKNIWEQSQSDNSLLTGIQYTTC